MAQEIEFPYTTSGLITLYAILRDGSGNFVNASTGALLTATTAHWPTAAIALSDSTTTFDYVATVPENTPVGFYTYNVFLKLGGSPVTTDILLGVSSVPINWSGTASIGNSTLTQTQAQTAAAAALIAANIATLIQASAGYIRIDGGAPSGDFFVGGIYPPNPSNGRPYFVRASGPTGTADYFWWDGDDWQLSAALGMPGSYHGTGSCNLPWQDDSWTNDNDPSTTPIIQFAAVDGTTTNASCDVPITSIWGILFAIANNLSPVPPIRPNAPALPNRWVPFANTMIPGSLVTGTSPGGGTTGNFILAAAVANTGDFVGSALVVVSGTGLKKTRVITSSTGGSAIIVITPAWEAPPDATSNYAIMASKLPTVDSSLKVTTANPFVSRSDNVTVRSDSVSVSP